MDKFTNEYCNEELKLMCDYLVQNDSSDMCREALEGIIIRNDQIEKLVDALDDVTKREEAFDDVGECVLCGCEDENIVHFDDCPLVKARNLLEEVRGEG